MILLKGNPRVVRQRAATILLLPLPPRLRQTGGENKIYMNLFFRNIQILHSSDRITAERERERTVSGRRVGPEVVSGHEYHD